MLHTELNAHKKMENLFRFSENIHFYYFFFAFNIIYKIIYKILHASKHITKGIDKIKAQKNNKKRGDKKSFKFFYLDKIEYWKKENCEPIERQIERESENKGIDRQVVYLMLQLLCYSKLLFQCILITCTKPRNQITSTDSDY